jgi:hypothetical protein
VLNGTGTVRSTTRVHSPARQPSPWGLVQVESVEGVLVVGFTDEALAVGDAVTVVRVDDGLPVFVSCARP